MIFSQLSLRLAPIIVGVMAFGASAQAQMMQWGSGQWGGQQQCPYQTSMGQGSMSKDDGLSSIANDIKQAQKDLQTKQAAQKKADKEASRAEQDINDALESDHADFIVQHLSNRFACDEYDIPQAASQESDMAAAGDEGGAPLRRADKKKMSTKPFAKNDWAQYCTDTGVSTSVCDNAAYRVEGGTRYAADKCKKGISAYKKSYAQSQKLASEIDRLKETIESLKEQYADAKETAAEDRKMGLTAGFSADTEAGGCEECGRIGNGRQSGGGTDWANVISNGVTAVAAIGLGAYMNNKVTESNAELGFPTGNLYPAWGYGLPYAQQAMYGAISGMTGQGSFGCGGNSGASVGGAFGYPQSMMMGGMNGMGSFGGGMYLGGMSPMGSMMGYGGYGNMMGSYGNMMGMGGMMSVGGLMSNPYGSMMGTMMSGYGNMMGYGSMMGGLMSLGGLTGYGSLMSGGTMMGSMMGTMMGYGSLMNGGLMMSGYGSLASGGMMDYSAYYQQQAAKYSQLTSLQSEMQALQYRMQMIQAGYYSGYGSTGSLSSSIGSLNSGIYNYGSLTGTTGLTPVGISSGGTIYQER